MDKPKNEIREEVIRTLHRLKRMLKDELEFYELEIRLLYFKDDLDDFIHDLESPIKELKSCHDSLPDED